MNEDCGNHRSEQISKSIVLSQDKLHIIFNGMNSPHSYNSAIELYHTVPHRATLASHAVSTEQAGCMSYKWRFELCSIYFHVPSFRFYILLYIRIHKVGAANVHRSVEYIEFDIK